MGCASSKPSKRNVSSDHTSHAVPTSAIPAPQTSTPMPDAEQATFKNKDTGTEANTSPTSKPSQSKNATPVSMPSGNTTGVNNTGYQTSSYLAATAVYDDVPSAGHSHSHSHSHPHSSHHSSGAGYDSHQGSGLGSGGHSGGYSGGGGGGGDSGGGGGGGGGDSGGGSSGF
ncbi:hypothetical protein CC80DRAFT_259535 [Byssothecium circinans]|uniref:Uncharacterized protein n=1 Tax=Byssothecium circinans TaxID=147558 RepID=A0A6A5U993_9PLEO|nr:hypothetical protein CC80DRAFT_259535 [Byssothecium circinans]